PYSGPIAISGANAWEWKASDSGPAGGGKFAANGSFLDNLEFADRDKDRTFIDSIASGPTHNQIAAGVETALTCMMGRMAGLKQAEVTWEELLQHGETYELGFTVDEFAKEFPTWRIPWIPPGTPNDQPPKTTAGTIALRSGQKKIRSSKSDRCVTNVRLCRSLE